MVEKLGGNYHKNRMFQILGELIFEELDTAEKVNYREHTFFKQNCNIFNYLQTYNKENTLNTSGNTLTNWSYVCRKQFTRQK